MADANAVTVHSLEHTYKALADSTRLRILALLVEGEVCVCEIHDTLRLPQPTASRHLAYLKQAGLIAARKNSYWTFYARAAARTPLHTKVLECLEADDGGRRRDAKRLAAVRRSGGCCPV